MECKEIHDENSPKSDSSKRQRSLEDDDFNENPKKRMSFSSPLTKDELEKNKFINCKSKSLSLPVNISRDSFDEEEIFSLSPIESLENDSEVILIKDPLTRISKSQGNEGTESDSTNYQEIKASLPPSDPINIDSSLCKKSSTLSLTSNLSHINDEEFHNEDLDLELISSSIFETESLTSLSQSLCSEDSSVSSKKSKKKKGKKKKIVNIGDESKEENTFLRPNYFVGVQVSNPEIHKAVIEVQNDLVSFNEKLGPALIDVATLHITLLVAHIATDEDLHLACSTLDTCGAILSKSASDPPITLKFNCISHFSNQTIYAKIVENEEYFRLLSVAQVVRTKFSESGITMPDKKKELFPHLTIAKLSKVPRGKGKSGMRKIDPAAYQSHLDKVFGEQQIGSLQLLSMNKLKDKNRYYYNSREAVFDFVPTESSDHTQCCHPRRPVLPKLSRSFHTSSSSGSSSLPSLFPFSRRGASFSPQISFATALIGGAAFLSLAYAFSRWMRKK